MNNKIKIITIFICFFLSQTSFLYAGGTATKGYLSVGGNFNVCPGETFVMSIVTDLPNIHSIHWEVKKGVGRTFIKMDGVTDPTIYLYVKEASHQFNEFRAFYKSGNTGYYTEISRLNAVDSRSQPGTISENQYVVSTSAPATLTGTAGSIASGDIRYSWQQSVDQSNWMDVPSAGTSASYSPPAKDVTTYYRRIAQNQAGYCRSSSNEVKVEVLKASISGGVSAFCAGVQALSSLKLSISNSSKVPEVQWEKQKDNGAWSTIEGAVSTEYYPFEVVAGVYKYRAKVLWESRTQVMYTNERTITCHPSLSGVSVTPTTQSVVEGLLPAPLQLAEISGGGGPPYTYQWEKQTPSSGVGGWSILSTATEAIYQASVLEFGTYRCLVSSNSCSLLSNVGEIVQLPLNPGRIGHHATIGLHGRHKPLVTVAPTNGTDFRWERRVMNGSTWSDWSVVQDWSSEQTYTPTDPLQGVDGTRYQYHRLARVVPSTSETSNEVEILMSAVDPGSILLPDSRINLVCYDTVGWILQDDDYKSSEGTQKRFRWQVQRPGNLSWVNLTEWGDSTTLRSYQDTSPLMTVGEHIYHRQFVQDELNQDNETFHKNSNQVSVWVEALIGGEIATTDTILSLNATPGRITNTSSGNGSYYQWQYRDAIEGSWSNLTEWITDALDYVPVSPMTGPLRQYRRLCKTLLSTPDDLSVPSNIVTVRVQVVKPGSIALAKPVIVRGGRVELVNVESGTGTVFKWQVNRKQEDGSWSGWVTLGTDIFSSDKLGAKDENVIHESKYRRLTKSSLSESDLWVSYSNDVTISLEPLKGGMIARSQTILKYGVPSKFTNVEAGNGEVYQWLRKREGESAFRPVTDFRFQEREYQETEPVNVTTYYRRLAKPLMSSDNRDTVGGSSNTLVVTPSIDLTPGTIALSSSGTIDTLVDAGSLLEKFHSIVQGNAIVFKWQKNTENTWIDLTDWGNHVTYKDITPIFEPTMYRRCVKPHRTSSDDLIKYSNTLTINLNSSLGGTISGDTTINAGDLPGVFRNISLGDENFYKWQKKVGGNIWTDVTEWSSANTEYIEKSGLLVTTYYRRLNKNDNGSEQEFSSSNIITVKVLGLDVRDETVVAENFYLTLDEVRFGLTDDMLIGRAQARAQDNLNMTSVVIQTPIIHNIINAAGTYQATFSTAKGESKTVKVYVVENCELVDGILLFAHNFTVYASEGLKFLTDDLLILRGEVRGYDLNTQTPISVEVRDRTAFDAAYATTPPTAGIYPVVFGYLGAMISVDVEIKEETTLTLSFDVNFDGVSDEIATMEVSTGKPYGNLPLPVRQGSEFLYWSLDIEGLTPIESSTIVGSVPGTDVDHTLYGIWKYPVLLDLNGGAGDSVIFVQQYRPYQYFQSLPIPQRRGYRFVGWSADVGGDKMIEGTTVVEKRNEHILYAMWAAREIMVIFNASGGTASPDRKLVTFGSMYGDFPIVEYGYYKFKGWFMSDGRTEVLPKDIVDTVAVEITLYAKYQTYAMADNDRYVITPNGDDVNDRFYLQFLWLNKANVKDVNVYIYDRKGTMVYHHKDYQGSDGNFDGSNLSDGTYIVVVRYSENGESKVYNATITILRKET